MIGHALPHSQRRLWYYYWDRSGFVRLFCILIKIKFLNGNLEAIDFKKVLLAKNEEYFSEKC